MKKGFTLSEILITLTIIGVVAAMTIPSIVKFYEKQAAASSFMKAFTTVSSAASSIREENGGDFVGLATSTLNFANIFKPYLSVLKFCTDVNDSANCYIPNNGNLYTLQGSIYADISPYPYSSYSKIVTSDGFMYWFENESQTCQGGKYSRNSVNENCGNLTVDINGKKPPNTYGKDLFVILINKYNVTPYNTDTNCVLPSASVWNGAGCSAKIIKEGGIYYY